MKRLKIIYILILSLFLINCSSGDDNGNSGVNRVSGKTFLFPVVQSQADCNFNQQISVVFNCANTLIFESNTDALI